MQDAPAQHWDVAKWLIPSVGALFVIVGYVAARGHYSLLGFDPGFLGTTEYGAITADFIGSVIDIVIDGVSAWPYLFTQPRLLLATAACLVLAAAIAISSRLATDKSHVPPGRRARTWAGLARVREFAKRPTMGLLSLLTVVLLKGLLLDAPVLRVEGALVTLGDAGSPGSAPYPLTVRLQKAAQEGGFDGLTASSAREIWTGLICRRVDAQAMKGNADVQCEQARGWYASRVKAEYLAHLIATGSIAWLAVLVLVRSKQVSRVAVAWLAVLYCLTLPYAYGKLIRSTEYQFGEFALKTQSDFKTDDINRGILNGFEVIRDGATATIATIRIVDCGNGKSRRDVKLWRVATGEILWHREIYRDDILGWKAVKERDDCPAVKPY